MMKTAFISTLLLSTFSQASLQNDKTEEPITGKHRTYSGTINKNGMLDAIATDLHDQNSLLTKSEALKLAQEQFDSLKDISPLSKERKIPRRRRSPNNEAE